MTPDSVDDAFRFLRACTKGDLRFDEHVRSLRFCFAPDGRLVMPVMVAMLSTFDTVLFAPEYGEDALELQLTLEPLDEHGELGGLCDRWRIHHGEPPDVRWAIATIDAARLDEVVYDGLALQRPNPLAAVEPRLVRELNERLAPRLPALCLEHAGVGIDEPRIVAVDPTGLLVRGRFDCHQIAFETMATSEAEVEAEVKRLEEGA